MFVVYLIILLIIIGLWILTRVTKPHTPSTDSSCFRPFLGVAVSVLYWYRKVMNAGPFGGRGNKIKVNKRNLESNLQILHPGETSDSQMYRFTVEKISLCFLIAFLGACLGLLLTIRAESERIMNDSYEIERNEYGGLDIEADLIAGIEGDENDEYLSEYSFAIHPRQYSDEEANQLFEQMSEEIDKIILGKNTSPEHVVTELNLVKSVEGYPFTISWETNNYELLDADGSVHNSELSSPVIVAVMGDCKYEDKHWYIQRSLQICPEELTDLELLQKEIMTAFEQADSETKSEKNISLPKSIDRGNIIWTEKNTDYAFGMILVIALLCLGIQPLRETEVRNEIKKRDRELLMNYPAFISKLTLYMSAGMSVRNCFIRMGNEYRRKNKTNNYLGQELIIVANELETGVSELEAYEHFGKRCGNREYMRFATLLCQNLRKGSTDLLRLLAKESEESFIIRKNEARKLGEEASTKLLLPMIMMLSIVMVIIMVPAYMSFSS